MAPNLDYRPEPFKFKKPIDPENCLVDEEWTLNGKTIRYVTYKSESQIPEFIGLIEKELSEPYSIFTYRYFLQYFPQLCLLAYDGDKCVGVILSKVDARQGRGAFPYKLEQHRGYIGMLAVDQTLRRQKIGSTLVRMTLSLMLDYKHLDEIVLEAEVTNTAALKLYTSLGFVKTKRLIKYYLSGTDAFRLRLTPLPKCDMDIPNWRNASINCYGNIGTAGISFSFPVQGVAVHNTNMSGTDNFNC